MMVMFTLPTIVVEVGVIVEIRLMFPVEPVVVVIVINLIPIVSMPRRISVIRISRISLFVDANGYVYLGAGGICKHRPGDDHCQNK